MTILAFFHPISLGDIETRALRENAIEEIHEIHEK
jgi:hypothetical protein